MVPNENLNNQNIVAPNFAVTQAYDYYRPGRLQTATERKINAPPNVVPRWRQTFGCDGFGNRTISAAVNITFQGNQPRAYNTSKTRPAVPIGIATWRGIYVYDAEGELAAEYRTDTADPAYTAGGASRCTQFLMADHLGSTRVVTALNGTVLGPVEVAAAEAAIVVVLR